jgi:hypothetical protein
MKGSFGFTEGNNICNQAAYHGPAAGLRKAAAPSNGLGKYAMICRVKVTVGEYSRGRDYFRAAGARKPGTLQRARQASEGRDAGLGAAQDQRVDVVRAFIGIHDLQVDHVADDAELVRNAVTAQHVAGDAGHVQRLAPGIALHHIPALPLSSIRCYKRAR